MTDSFACEVKAVALTGLKMFQIDLETLTNQKYVMFCSNPHTHTLLSKERLLFDYEPSSVQLDLTQLIAIQASVLHQHSFLVPYSEKFLRSKVSPNFANLVSDT